MSKGSRLEVGAGFLLAAPEFWGTKASGSGLGVGRGRDLARGVGLLRGVGSVGGVGALMALDIAPLGVLEKETNSEDSLPCESNWLRQIDYSRSK